MLKLMMFMVAAVTLSACGGAPDEGPAQGLPTGPIAYLTAPPCGADGLPTGPIAYAVPCGEVDDVVVDDAVDDGAMCVVVEGEKGLEAIPVQAVGMCDGKACCKP